MSTWPDNFSNFSLEEVLRQQAENRAWNKDLRRKANLLVNSRLANDISQEAYLAGRKLAHEETAECRRRAQILDNEISRCTVGEYATEPQRRENGRREPESGLNAVAEIACPDDTCHT
jgi:hypothetical protein